jgi:hypothetical protein
MKFILLWIFILHAFTLHAFTKRVTTRVISQNYLTDFKWQHRLLITQVDSERKLSQLRDEIQSYSIDFGARKLLALIRIEDNTWIINVSTAQTVSPSLSSEILEIISQNPDTILLIGLDGGIKYRYSTEAFSLKQVFNQIDLMPMRRAEEN